MREEAKLMTALASADGVNHTAIEGVCVYRASEPTPRSPLLYHQGIIVVGQGRKRVFLAGDTYEYDEDNYLVVPVPIPAECEALVPDDEPFLAILVDIELTEVARILTHMEDAGGTPVEPWGGPPSGLFVARADEAFRTAVLRLLTILQSPVEAGILGRSAVREVVYRVLLGENAAALRDLVVRGSGIARIDKALRHVHANYDQPVDVDTLAGIASMSPSAFHRAFKDVTRSSPIQYVKKVRLNKARALLADEGARASEAARRVGYESPSQFSREFKRYFGVTPLQAARPAS